MSDKNKIIQIDSIQNKIHSIRGVQVMLDSDLAELYEVQTKNLNLAVKRNIERFPDIFRFQLTEEENKSLRLQIETSKESRGGRRYLPYVFSEQGVAMLSAVLRSEAAVKVSIQIMQAFVQMRKFIIGNAGIFQRLDTIEQIKKHNQQYSKITIKELRKSHDRFIIIDKKAVYHFGASLKDLGKKWFAFSKMEMNAEEILGKLPALSGVEMENGGGDE